MFVVRRILSVKVIISEINISLLLQTYVLTNKMHTLHQSVQLGCRSDFHLLINRSEETKTRNLIIHILQYCWINYWC